MQLISVIQVLELIFAILIINNNFLKGCGDPPNNGCNNRRIAEGRNCIQLQLKHFPEKGFGAIAMEDVKKVKIYIQFSFKFN